MNIGILGSGTMGTALAIRLLRAGHDVRLGSRTPERAARDGGHAISHCSYDEAVAHGEIVILAIGWPHGVEALQTIAGLNGKILLDVSNPETEDGRDLVLGHTISGAETVAQNASGAFVVKAFNHVYAELLVEPAPLPSNPSVLFCGDDASAKQTVRTMIESCGLDAVDVGELSSARFLEPMAMLTVRMVRVLGNAPNAIAWKVLRATDASA